MLESSLFQLPGDHLPRPHGNCYWVIPGKVMAGEYPRDHDDASSRKKLHSILTAGVTQFVDLTETSEPLLPYSPLLKPLARATGVEAVHIRHAVRDRSVPTAAQMRAILDELSASVAGGRCTYLHCWGGIGRTGTVVGCMLVEAGFSPEHAIDLIASKWKVVAKRDIHPSSPETREQFSFIRNWKENVNFRRQPDSSGRT
jgi:Cyclin-dependent kinase inhibitor 3 (CDKN3)